MGAVIVNTLTSLLLYFTCMKKLMTHAVFVTAINNARPKFTAGEMSMLGDFAAKQVNAIKQARAIRTVP